MYHAVCGVFAVPARGIAAPCITRRRRVMTRLLPGRWPALVQRGGPWHHRRMALLPASAAPEAGPAREGKILVHVTPQESQTLQAWAARSDKPLAVLVRDAALAAASRGT